MKSFKCSLLFPLTLALFVGCSDGKKKKLQSNPCDLTSRVLEVLNEAPGTVGVAFVCDDDTLLANNGVRFPMMSVFKLHQSLAVIDELERKGMSPDSELLIPRSVLDPDTWSPMLKDYPTDDIRISPAGLIRYALEVSDNNASNLMFDKFVSPEETNRYIRAVAPDTTFRIRWAESDMGRSHELSYENYTSPLSAALLIEKVMTDTVSFSGPTYNFIRETLANVSTGTDRLAVVAAEEDVVLFAHKTGSGFRNERGELMAHNDVGYFRLSDGRDYSLAVFVRDFRGNEVEASSVISQISRIFYEYMVKSGE